MRLDARSGLSGEVWDLDTGRQIPLVRWVDLPDVPGAPAEYEAFKPGPDGNPYYLPDVTPKTAATYRGRARIKFVPKGGFPEAAPTAPVLKPQGKRRQVHHRKRVPLFSDRCQHYACNRVATWSVSDEVGLDPVLVDNQLFTRGRVVGRRHYCAFHYKPPRLLDARGEEIEKFEEAGGVRPQWHS